MSRRRRAGQCLSELARADRVAYNARASQTACSRRQKNHRRAKCGPGGQRIGTLCRGSPGDRACFRKSQRNSSERSGSCSEAAAAPCSPPPFPQRRHRLARRVARVRSHGAHRGLRARSDLRRPFQPGRVGRAVGGRTLPGVAASVLHRRAGRGRHRRRRRAVPDRQRQGRLRVSRRLRLERLRRALAGRVLACSPRSSARS